MADATGESKEGNSKEENVGLNPCKRKRKLTDTERKRRKIKRNIQFHKSRVYLGTEQIRWAELKKEKNLKTDREVATLLIDNYKRTESQQQMVIMPTQPRLLQLQKSSTPASMKDLPISEVKTPSVSEVSGPESEREQHHELSGFEELRHSEDSNGKVSSGPSGVQQTISKAGRQTGVKKLSDSFIDPFNLTIDITTVEEEEESDDPDYEPSFTIEAVLPRNIDEAAEDVAYEEAEFGFEIENGMIEEELELDEDLPTFSSINRITTPQECEDLSKSTKCIVELEQLKGLASIHIEKCSSLDCAKSLKISTDFVGSALYLKWVCQSGHVSMSWCSQPVLNKRLHSGDFLICASILMSGNNYGKLALWAEMMHLKF
ncbi:uncharacterized protein LOC132746454 [Ruditapes philippinarum]|uniref:uncharacterized protein LOC132746454 n=1 Tax=Ruditapes philippinarum TaxID=129788 RepID=UPI00295A8A23|nr:uncharacterized protein LOC132746454 [Ruditapes philippinarum]